MKIEYTKVRDYYLPNLYYPEETRPIGFWGMLRKEYLKEHKSGMYSCLLLTARLDRHLADVNRRQAVKNVKSPVCLTVPTDDAVIKQDLSTLKNHIDYE